MVALANSLVELERGQTLDRYELVYPVARGGMARVWVAKLRGKHGFEKMVALKTILPSFAEDQRFRRMFLDEAKIASGIEHVNVAQILDLGEQSGQLYLVMEWVDGDSLQELDRAAERVGRELPIPVIVRVVADACAGLHAAHELQDAQGKSLNVVHRDVSPQNILVSSRGVVKVIDFGVVKARRRATEETTTGTIKGKLIYMAPEQALSHPVDRRADIWSVGATLYRLLARRPVFQEASPIATFKRLTSAVQPEPLPPHVPGALASIVLKALAFDRERRYATAAELSAALEGLLQGPYQTTAREVAACVDMYLGPALGARRTAIADALGGGAVAREATTLPDVESRLSQGKTLAVVPAPLAVSEPPTSLEIPATASAVEEATRPLRSVPTRPAGMSSRAKWFAFAGSAAVLGVLGWVASVPPASTARPPQSSSPPLAVVAVAAATVAAAPAPSPVMTLTVAPPQPPPPVSVQALPVLKEPAVVASATPSATSKRKVIAAPRPAPKVSKRKVVDDGF